MHYTEATGSNDEPSSAPYWFIVGDILCGLNEEMHLESLQFASGQQGTSFHSINIFQLSEQKNK